MKKNTTAYKKDILFMEGADLSAIARKFGTPLYCYSATQITENFMAYHTSMARVMDKRNFTVCYALKANGSAAVLKHLQKLGAGADIVSAGELMRAKKAGIAATKTVFSGVGKSDAEIETAVKAGLLQINVESAEEIDVISRFSKKHRVKTRIAIRVNPDVDAKTHKKISTGNKEDKFGIDINDAVALYDRARKLPGIDASGVAVHIGSQLTSLKPFERAYKRVAELVIKLRKRGHNITRVDLGGGIGITYKSETPPDMNLYALMIRDIIGPLGVHVILEPGRSIVGDAGVLLSRVIRTKKGHNKDYLIIDAAMNDLVRPAMYDAYHAIIPCNKKGAKKKIYDVVGPVCESSDIFLSSEKMHEMKPGDVVAILCAGAYGASMASTYNTRPLCAEAMVKGKNASLIRKRQTVAELLADDKVPAWI